MARFYRGRNLERRRILAPKENNKQDEVKQQEEVKEISVVETKQETVKPATTKSGEIVLSEKPKKSKPKKKGKPTDTVGTTKVPTTITLGTIPEEYFYDLNGEHFKGGVTVEIEEDSIIALQIGSEDIEFLALVEVNKKDNSNVSFNIDRDKYKLLKSLKKDGITFKDYPKDLKEFIAKSIKAKYADTSEVPGDLKEYIDQL